ncbi:DUF1565 domain-containing protein, partial [Candidatus Parcubacteria bacterium]|nr:DUF1565 domain-containing protein [Candidatus Parcubacteria bacterium]
GDDYEQYCKAMTMSDYGMRIYVDWEKISIPDTRTDYPLLKLKELFYEAAWKSYNLNHFQAQRPPSSNGSWKGELSKMYRIEYDIISRRWHIKGIGFLGQDWWECELDPGYYYIENTDLETTIPFVWQGKRGAYHLCEYFAREMLPAAVGYTAAVYKLFFETAEKMIKERGRDRYVAASGNDEFGIGTKARPYKTLGRAIQQSESGATIWVAPGSYSVDDYVYVYRKCRIIGDAVSKPVFTSTEKNGNIFRLAEPGTLVENICFIQKPGQGLTGILVFGANDKNQRVIIKNCEFMGLDSAIRTNRSSLAIESNLIRGCTWGIDFSGYDEETSSTVKANYFSGIGDKDLIVVGPSDRAEITGNTFNVAYDFSNYQAPMPRRLVANYHPTTLNARGNWWLLFGGLTPADLVGINIDVSRPLSSPDPKFQRLIIFESRGDFNADGQIDLGDFSLFVQYYGVSYGESRWNPRFDLSGNYQIDFSDFSIFAANFGARERAKMAAILGLQGFKLQDQPVVLLPNQPNPFNQETVIAYRLQSEAKVQLIIYNSLGQEVCVLADEPQGFGRHQVLWDGQDNEGRPVASGVYFYRLKAGKIRLVSRMALIR